MVFLLYYGYRLVIGQRIEAEELCLQNQATNEVF